MTDPAPIILPLTSIVDRLDFTALFSSSQPVEVELGSGDGSFLAQYAALHLQRNFLGVERLLGRLRKLERKCHRAKLVNVRALRIEAAYLLEWLLPRRSISALHIYFPDPWPKRKHRRHRLVNEQFPALVHATLASSGIVYLRTDDADYFAQMEKIFAQSPLFTRVETPAELVAVITDFERNFQKRGIGALRAAYRSNSNA